MNPFTSKHPSQADQENFYHNSGKEGTNLLESNNQQPTLTRSQQQYTRMGALEALQQHAIICYFNSYVVMLNVLCPADLGVGFLLYTYMSPTTTSHRDELSPPKFKISIDIPTEYPYHSAPRLPLHLESQNLRLVAFRGFKTTKVASKPFKSLMFILYPPSRHFQHSHGSIKCVGAQAPSTLQDSTHKGPSRMPCIKIERRVVTTGND